VDAEYIEQVEKLKRKPTFTVPDDIFCAYQSIMKGLPGIEFNLQQDGDDVWLRISRLSEISCPEPDDQLKPWITIHKSPEKKPELKNEIVIYEENVTVAVKKIEDHPEVQNSFDQFIDVFSKSEIEIAQLARELKIDIAVDLGGLTQDTRPSIFAFRAAPIQIGYIGFLSTMAAPYMDYIIADKTIIPAELQSAYTEKVIYLPSYQANDSKRPNAEKVFTREELGLPSKGFVFSSFNNSFKLTPSVFDGWARILKEVKGSVLYLYAENETVSKNLSSEIEKRGVDKKRLVFGGRLSREDYLARYRVADLFLDTTPYNAGTTASDALWMGLPVLTMLGHSFSARMGASLLNAIGLPELIASSQKDYEALAISLALDPCRIAEIKEKLMRNIAITPLFNSELFTKNLETAYEAVYDRYQNDLSPEHIDFVC